MTAPEKENLMMKDQARKEASKLAKRKPFPVGLLLLPAIIFVFALVAFGFYLYLDREIESNRQEEFEKAKTEFENTPAPEPSTVEGRKLYFIWECELYEYDVDLEASELISAEVASFKDVDCFDNALFAEEQEIVVSKSENEIIDGVYFFDFTSSNILSKLEISSGADQNAYDFDNQSKTIFQAIKNDAIYSINSETKEVKKLLDTPGFDPDTESALTDEFSLSLSPDRKSILSVDSISLKYDPNDVNAKKEDYLSIRMFDLTGKELDSTVGTFGRWVDAGRIIYWPYKKLGSGIVIRTVKSKSEINLLPAYSDEAKLMQVSAIATDPETSLIAVTYSGIDQGDVLGSETQLYDNTTGVTTKLSTFILQPEFLFGEFLVGYVDDGVIIYSLKTNESKIIIGK